MGKTGPENSKFAAGWRQAAIDEYNKSQNLAAAQKAQAEATRDAGKAQREAAQTAEQYSRKIADLSVAIEVQKVRAKEGEQAAELYAAANQTGAKWTEEQRTAIRAQSAELARLTQLADDHVRKIREQADALKDLREASRKFSDEAAFAAETSGMGDRQKQRYEETQQVERVFSKTDQSTRAIHEREMALASLDKKYREIAASESNWRNGVSRGYNSWFDEMTNIAGTVSDGVKSSLDGAFSNVTAMLEGNKVSWKSWGISVLQIIEKVALQMAVVSAMGSVSSSSGLIGSLVGGVTSFFSGGGTGASPAGQSFAVPSFTPNALGGVYDSPSLSTYSNGIYNSPQFFAFAQGAGVFAEAGPEAIMPLTRASDGSLGVRAVGSGVNNVSTAAGAAPQVNVYITDSGNKSTATPGYEQLGREAGAFIDRRYRELIGRDLAPGGNIWNLARGNR
jgi:lambda family phage tail tape measure protein